MRDINNLNREHDNKLKAERTTCCNCPTGKEIIFCGCDCHKQGYIAIFDKAKGAWAVPAIGEYYETKEEAEFQANQPNAFACVECGEVYSEESGAYNGFTCEECVSKREE